MEATNQTPLKPGEVEYEIACKVCGAGIKLRANQADVEAAQTFGIRLARMIACDDCKEAALRNELRVGQLEADMRAADVWGGICPPEFQLTLDHKRSRAPKGCYDELMGHAFGREGLVLHGPTGRCKTRFFYHWLRYQYEDGRSIFATGHPAWRMKCASIAQDSQRRLIAWSQWQKNVDIWFLDDLGKGNVSESSTEALEDIIDHRTTHGRPIYVTTMYDMETLRVRLGDNERARAMVRRLLDYCKPINFDGR